MASADRIDAPRPYRDEMLYSVVARAARYIGVWSPKALNGALFGRRGFLPSPDLPTGLSSLAPISVNAWRLTAEELAERHTLLGYYTHYLGSDGRRQVLEAMLGTGQRLQVRLGISASCVVAPSRFRLCPKCVEHDLQVHGETYWRRAHHLPGVLVCPIHGVGLHETEVPFRPVGRHEHVAAAPSMLRAGRGSLLENSASLEIARWVAAESARLLDAPASTLGPLRDFRSLLGASGYGRRGPALERLREVAATTFGEVYLGSVFKAGGSGDVLRWMEESVTAPRRPLHALKHLVIERCLTAMGEPDQVAQPPLAAAAVTSKTWGIYRSAALRTRAQDLARKGLTTNAIATRLGVDWKTAARLLAELPIAQTEAPSERQANDRQAWQQLSRAHRDATRSQLRAMAPQLYARLYRRDSAWLMSHGPKRQRPAGPNNKRVDWPARDEALAAKVREVAQTILATVPPLRASRNRVLGVLAVRHLVARSGRHLPLTQQTLTALCESSQHFQLRRLRQVIAADASVPGWKALREARINPDRYPDMGKGLLQSAGIEPGARTRAAS